MIHLFEDFELDETRVELRSKGAIIAIEPQVFTLLVFLVGHRDRLVTRDEIIEGVWGGRIVSDSAIASRIKSARQALGDDGRAQRFIRTIHGLGFRFVAEVKSTTSPGGGSPVVAESESPELPTAGQAARPSIAVLPFRLLGDAGPYFVIADALPQDLITELSRLHWLFVIARASSFQFRGSEAGVERVRQALHVRYCLSGTVEILGGTMTVSVELCETGDSGVVWSDRFRGKMEDAHDICEEIVRVVISALELQIPLHEARTARLKPPEHLDAWSAYHLGLQRMYRFNKADNASATEFFERAAAGDPGFARAYAGLSFTHFQNAFLHYSDAGEATRLAEHYAGQCLERDPVDPFGNFTMGRVFWLRGDLAGSLPWLERANALNPNYAQAKYSRGWAQALLGEAAESRTNIDAALALSPLDPFVYGMMAVRAFSHIACGESAEAADWAERAARSPGAHALIEMVAVVGHGMKGDEARAREWALSARTREPGFTHHDFLRAFPFRDQATRERIVQVLRHYDFA